MGELKGRRVIERFGLLRDRGDDRIAIMPGICAPQAGRSVEHGTILRRVVVHALGARDQPRRAFERTVGRKRHPKRFQIVWNTD